VEWDERLKLQDQRKFNNYKVHRIALDAVLVNKEFVIPGDIVIVVQASSSSAEATIRFNRDSNEALVLVEGKIRKTVFTKFYLSCAAQTGQWLDLLIGIDFDENQILSATLIGQGVTLGGGTAQQVIIVTNASAGVDTQAAAHVCKGALLKALSTNTGLVWVNFGAAAVSGSSYDLAAGDVLPVPVDNTNKIHALFAVANEKLVVIYKAV
jgi:hypothetical protein